VNVINRYHVWTMPLSYGYGHATHVISSKQR